MKSIEDWCWCQEIVVVIHIHYDGYYTVTLMPDEVHNNRRIKYNEPLKTMGLY